MIWLLSGVHLWRILETTGSTSILWWHHRLWWHLYFMTTHDSCCKSGRQTRTPSYMLPCVPPSGGPAGSTAQHLRKWSPLQLGLLQMELVKTRPSFSVVAWKQGQGGRPWTCPTAGKGKPRIVQQVSKSGVGEQGWGEGRKDSSWALGEYSGLIACFLPLELQSKEFLWFKHPCLCRLCYVSPRKLTYAFQAHPHWLPRLFFRNQEFSHVCQVFPSCSDFTD